MLAFGNPVSQQEWNRPCAQPGSETTAPAAVKVGGESEMFWLRNTERELDTWVKARGHMASTLVRDDLHNL